MQYCLLMLDSDWSDDVKDKVRWNFLLSDTSTRDPSSIPMTDPAFQFCLLSWLASAIFTLLPQHATA